jgi:hypothetical protein
MSDCVRYFRRNTCSELCPRSDASRVSFSPPPPFQHAQPRALRRAPANLYFWDNLEMRKIRRPLLRFLSLSVGVNRDRKRGPATRLRVFTAYLREIPGAALQIPRIYAKSRVFTRDPARRPPNADQAARTATGQLHRLWQLGRGTNLTPGRGRGSPAVSAATCSARAELREWLPGTDSNHRPTG